MAWLSSPMVTCRSCMASSSALCTLAGARLISSASSRLVKIGPLRVVNSEVLGLKTMVPVRSAGSRSGVNWMRLKSRSVTRARVLTARVLARPGTPSSRMCPEASSAIIMRSSSSFWPTMTLAISARVCSIAALSSLIFSLMNARSWAMPSS